MLHTPCACSCQSELARGGAGKIHEKYDATCSSTEMSRASSSGSESSMMSYKCLHKYACVSTFAYNFEPQNTYTYTWPITAPLSSKIALAFLLFFDIHRDRIP